MEPTACPTDETLTHFAEGRLSSTVAAELGAHTESCANCRQVVGLLLRLKSSSEGRVPSLADPGLAAPLLPLETTVGRYVLRRFVGAGAMGVVFEAEDPALKRRVAVKVMRSASSEKAQALLQREAQVMAQLSHRNVATVFDVGVFEGRAWVAMEFIEGPTLRAWLQTPRDEPAVLQRLLDAGRGLSAAHAAGVVHRDFKPDNVLVENAAGHRTVVTDFGLSLGSAQTAARAVVGTPAYMAPEQRDGFADPRSDQFGFCVTAVEAFTGKRPFDAGTIDAAVVSLVPRRLRPALARGLSLDPQERWPSLDALLAALAPPRRERQVAAAVAALSMVALSGVGFTSWRRAHVCDSASAAVSAVWNAEAREAIAKAFTATGLPVAPEGASAVAGELDRWASGWTASATGICEATEVQHTQSGELMDLRRECLDERLLEVKALITALAQVDAKGANAAAEQGLQLTSLSVCDDEQALRAPMRAPLDPATAQKVKQVREALATASALRVTDQFPAAKAALEPLELATQQAKYRPLEADVLVQAGMLASELEDYPGAGEKLQRALVAAQAGGHVKAAAQAWIALTLLDGVKLGHPAEGHRAAELASAASERLGRPAMLEAPLATNLGTLLAEEGKHEEARASYQSALTAYRALDTDTLTLAQALNAVGAEERSLGHVKEALALHEEALAFVTSRYSSTHPAAGPITKNLGNIELEAGRFAEALAWYEKSLAVERAAFGASSLQVASTQSNIAASLLRQSKLKEAEPLLRGALEITEKKLGPEHPSLFGPLNNLAVLLRYTDRAAQAEEALRRALAIAEKTYGPMHEEVATTLINLGDVQLSRKDFVGSVKSYERAIVVTEKTSGPTHSNLADCWGGLAFPLMELHEWAKALEATDKAQAIYAKSPGQPYPEGLVHFAHARALWEVVPARRPEAKKEAAAARASLEKVGAQPEELAEIEAWLKR